MTLYLAIHFACGLIALGLAIGSDPKRDLGIVIGAAMIASGPLALGINLGLILRELAGDDPFDEEDDDEDKDEVEERAKRKASL
jgi:hypothetical protein